MRGSVGGAKPRSPSLPVIVRFGLKRFASWSTPRGSVGGHARAGQRADAAGRRAPRGRRRRRRAEALLDLDEAVALLAERRAVVLVLRRARCASSTRSIRASSGATAALPVGSPAIASVTARVSWIRSIGLAAAGSAPSAAPRRSCASPRGPSRSRTCPRRPPTRPRRRHRDGVAARGARCPWTRTRRGRRRRSDDFMPGSTASASTSGREEAAEQADLRAERPCRLGGAERRATAAAGGPRRPSRPSRRGRRGRRRAREEPPPDFEADVTSGPRGPAPSA